MSKSNGQLKQSQKTAPTTQRLAGWVQPDWSSLIDLVSCKRPHSNGLRYFSSVVFVVKVCSEQNSRIARVKLRVDLFKYSMVFKSEQIQLVWCLGVEFNALQIKILNWFH